MRSQLATMLVLASLACTSTREAAKGMAVGGGMMLAGGATYVAGTAHNGGREDPKNGAHTVGSVIGTAGLFVLAASIISWIEWNEGGPCRSAGCRR